MTHRFSPIPSPGQNYNMTPGKIDGNVDNDQAHALFLASKQRAKNPFQDLADPKPTTQMKRITKH